MKKLDIVNTVLLVVLAGLFAFGIFFQNSHSARLKQTLAADFYAADAETAKKIYRGLKLLGSDDIDSQIKSAFQSSDLHVRVSAVELLSIVGGNENLSILKNSVNDDNKEIAVASIRGLGNFPPSKIKTTLFDLIKSKNVPKQMAALRAITKNNIKEFGEELNKIDTKDFDSEVKTQISTTLSVIGYKKKVTPSYYDDY
jgi:hypothetical protein